MFTGSGQKSKDDDCIGTIKTVFCLFFLMCVEYTCQHLTSRKELNLLRETVALKASSQSVISWLKIFLKPVFTTEAISLYSLNTKRLVLILYISIWCIQWKGSAPLRFLLIFL